MANITLLKEPLLGWDSGCGNVLLDIHMQQTQNRAYDKDGEFAKSGQLSKKLLSSMLSDEYFHKTPPKSTGREHFNASWLLKHLAKFPELSSADKQRTLTELTAQSVADTLKSFEIEEIIVCGGGAKNGFLLQRLHKLTEAKIIKEPNSDALEAMAFAWLAYKRVHKERIALSSVTGASKNSILGALYE
jgi:anhydro-N-acetylmuramic acid kinase